MSTENNKIYLFVVDIRQCSLFVDVFSFVLAGLMASWSIVGGTSSFTEELCFPEMNDEL